MCLFVYNIVINIYITGLSHGPIPSHEHTHAHHPLDPQQPTPSLLIALATALALATQHQLTRTTPLEAHGAAQEGEEANIRGSLQLQLPQTQPTCTPIIT